VRDGPSSINPLVREAPFVPMETLRPAANLQRVLLLDRPGPQMADLASGDVRRYENGPPISIPMVSTRFDLGAIDRLQIQVLRDPRPTSISTTLVSLHLGEAKITIDVVESPDGQLLITSSGGRGPRQISGPIGASPAVVVVVQPDAQDATVAVTARNAETMESLEMKTSASSLTKTLVTIGGPTTEVTGAYGRRRSIPVHVELTTSTGPVDQLQRGLRLARRIAASARNRAG
jgi:hypothetical protein